MTAMRTFVHGARTGKMAPETLEEDARRAYAKLSALINARKEFRPATDEHE